MDESDSARSVVEFLILNCAVLFQIDGVLRDAALRWAALEMVIVLIIVIEIGQVTIIVLRETVKRYGTYLLIGVEH